MTEASAPDGTGPPSARTIPGRTRPRLRLIFPSLTDDPRKYLSSDIVAGIALVAILIPQGMAYAEIVGLPPVAGLYATMLPIVGYALLGSSRQLVVGPDSSASALAASVLVPFAIVDPSDRAMLAAALAIMVGLVCLAAGLLRLGFIADFLSRPVLTGYINGLAVTIVVSQLPKILGFPVPADRLVQELLYTIQHLSETNLWSLALGILCLAIILGFGRYLPQVPGVLVAVVVAMVLSVVLDLGANGVVLTGDVPSGLPALSVPRPGFDQIVLLIPGALGLALVSLGDTIATSRSFAIKNGYQVDADRDLLGLGAAQVAAGLAGGFAISASASRTAVAEASGGRTQVANLVAAGAVALVLIFLAPVLSVLPKPALGAVVLAAAIGLFDVGSLRRYYLERRIEFWVAIATMIAVALVDPLAGLILAIAISLVDVLRQVTQPGTAILGRLPESGSWQNVRRYPAAVTQRGLIIYRVEAPLFFANAERIRAEIEAIVRANAGSVEWVVFDAEAMTDLDISAAQVLAELDDSLEAMGVTFCLAEPNGRVVEMLRRTGLLRDFGRLRVFATLDAAVEAYSRRAEAERGQAPHPALADDRGETPG
jgi:high affinity sulfate transporter 1